IFMRQALNAAKDLGLSRISVLLNTPDALSFIGKAVEGAILGAYSFDKYKKEKSPLGKINVDLVTLRSQDQQNRHYLNRYTIVSEEINEARDIINEPGSVATPEHLAETARRIAKEVDLDVKVWDE